MAHRLRRGRSAPGCAEGGHEAMGCAGCSLPPLSAPTCERNLTRCARSIQMRTASPPTRTCPLCPHDVRAASIQMCASALPSCAGPSLPAGAAPPDVPVSAAGPSCQRKLVAKPELAMRPGRLPAPALQRQGLRLFSVPGRAAPVRGARCYSWLCHGLIGRGRASSLFSCLLMWVASSPRDAVGSGSPQGWESQRIKLLLRGENRKRAGGRK